MPGNDTTNTVATTRIIAGNVSEELKEQFSDLHSLFGMKLEGAAMPLFGDSIIRRLQVTEISIQKKAEEPLKDEGRVVLEIEVREDMANGGMNVHGGCTALLIDICSTLALSALQFSQTNQSFYGVSQSLNIIYHSPATIGDTLRIVNTTMAAGARALSARTEIWNATHHRLIASGTHTKMQPSEPKPSL